jgi:hypothetical protein
MKMGSQPGHTNFSEMHRTMKTTMEYRKHAQDCRKLARGVPDGDQRNQLLEMARTWDRLAETREGLVRNHPELDTAQSAITGQQSGFPSLDRRRVPS